MLKYVVENTKTEERTMHRTWRSALRAAAKHDPHSVRIRETDRDGSREYNWEGRMLEPDGHYHK